MLNESAAQLVTHFNHANGWWRDTAAAAARAEAGPFRRTLASNGWCRNARANLLGRFHALWTLEGLGRARPSARALCAEGGGAAHADPGAARERIALQSRRQIVRRRLARTRTGSGCRCGHPGDADDAGGQGARYCGGRQVGHGQPHGARRAVCGRPNRESSGERRRRWSIADAGPAGNHGAGECVLPYWSCASRATARTGAARRCRARARAT